jgi:hypothetical protein
MSDKIKKILMGLALIIVGTIVVIVGIMQIMDLMANSPF